MKRLKLVSLKLIALTVAVMLGFLLTGCENNPNDKNLVTFVDKNDSKWIVVKDSSTVGAHTEQVFVEKVVISPTAEQALYYSFKAGYAGQLAIGFILMLLSLAFAYKYSRDEPIFDFGEDYEKVTMYVNLTAAFICLAVSIGMLLGKPVNIYNDNEKAISKEYFDKTVKKYGSSKPIWDSLENNCLILSGPTKNCK